mgnify:FL=1|jgi:hypothetical protein
MISALACMAVAIYFEARAEPLAGQIAVANVVINRVMADQYPDDVCEVITQGRLGSKPTDRIRKHQCQFSFYCDGLSDTPKDLDAFRYAIDIASNILGGVWFDPTDGATHYHSIDVAPSWAKTKVRIVRIENHIFYKGIEMREKKEKGFQPDSARKGGRKSMLMHQGFPDYIKNKDAREAHVAKVMGDQRYQDVRFKQPLNKVINWNQVQQHKRTLL